MATAGLVTLVLLDVVLVGVALRPVQAASGVEKVTTSSAAASGQSLGSSAAKSSAMRSSAPSAPPGPLETMLVAVDDQRAWRISAGTCAEGGATLTRTVDGGKTWAEGQTSLNRIVRVLPAADQTTLVIGSFSACAALVKQTSNGGDSWGSAGSVENVWFRDPKNARVVGAPGSSTSQPCETGVVVDLAVVSATSARVLCVDGALRQTRDTGSSWADMGTVAGAVALAVGSPDREQTVVARLNAPYCAGVQILRAGKNADVFCVPSAIPKDSGQIALSLVEGGGWLAVGDTTMRSTDDLVTWSVS